MVTIVQNKPVDKSPYPNVKYINTVDAGLVYVGPNNKETKKLISPGLLTGDIITKTAKDIADG